jgi:hypothetical protein
VNGYARVTIPHGARAPFRLNKQFRKALNTTLEKFGGLSWLQQEKVKPSKRFLETLSKYYTAASH